MKNILIFSSLLLSLSLSGCDVESLANSEMQNIENQVAEDAVRQYEIAKRSGTAIDAYVHAGIVSAAYLQAEDEENYKKWKAIEKEQAVALGIPTE
jgi:hypothetical protein